MKIKSLLINLGCLSAILMGGFSCSPRQEYYGVTDFEKVPKIDGHFHYVTMDERYLDFAASLNFKLLSPNVDSKTPIDKQLEIASGITGRNKGRFGFFGTFSVDSFGNTDFASLTIARIRETTQVLLDVYNNNGKIIRAYTKKELIGEDTMNDFNLINLNIDDKGYIHKNAYRMANEFKIAYGVEIDQLGKAKKIDWEKLDNETKTKKYGYGSIQERKRKIQNFSLTSSKNDGNGSTGITFLL